MKNERYYDKNLCVPQTRKQLERRGLIRPDVDLPAIGIVKLIEDDFGFDTDIYQPVATGTVDIRDDGLAYMVYGKKRRASDPDAEFDIRSALCKKIDARRDVMIASGVSFAFSGNSYTLQTRDSDDRLDWTNLLIQALFADPEDLMEVRVESNAELEIPAGQTAPLLTAGVKYIKAIKKASWALKNAVRDAATDDAAFDAFEAGIDTAWPDSSPISVPAT